MATAQMPPGALGPRGRAARQRVGVEFPYHRLMQAQSVERSAPAEEPGSHARTRGLNPLAALAYVREHGGENSMTRVLHALPPEDLEHISGNRKLTSRTWVPFSLQSRLLKAIDETLGCGDSATLFVVGNFMARRDIPRIFRPLLKLGNPGWIVEVATRMWRYYHDRGRWEIQRTPVTILATLHGHPESSDAFCATFVGWLTGCLEISGGHDVMVDHPVCHARGAANCVFTCRWANDTPVEETGLENLMGGSSEMDVSNRSRENTAVSRRQRSPPKGRSKDG